jgi:hypothetical protein
MSFKNTIFQNLGGNNYIPNPWPKVDPSYYHILNLKIGIDFYHLK